MMTETLLFKPSPIDWKPHDYQKKGIKFLIEHACAALFEDPGLGKTSQVLGAIKVLKKKKLVSKVLLIAPLRVCYSVWPKEIQKWTDFNGLKIEILHGPKKDEALEREADIYVINPEGLDWLLDVKRTKVTSARTGKTTVKIDVDLRRFKKFGFDTLVIDELTKFKHTTSGRFKALKLVHKTFGRRWGLTGSPASNGLLDLFGQCYILDEGRALGPYVTHYKNTYFRAVDKNQFVWVPQDGAEQRIYERLSPLALRMAAEDYLDMPQMIVNNIKLDMPEDARAIYDRMEEDLITMIEDKAIVASTAAVASGKCRQIANGGLYLTPEVTEMGYKILKGKKEWVDLHNVKVDALEDLVEELQGSPLLVAYDFGHDLARLRARFPKAAFACDYKMKEFTKLEEAWNRGEIPLLFGHPQSIGHGLNLQEQGHHVAWHSMTWDFELYDQFVRRILRQGNKHKKVFIHHLMMRDTIDEIMYYSLKSKNKGQQALFTGLKELAKIRRKK
jgi:SNF2 family DNA or RNA helicase